MFICALAFLAFTGSYACGDKEVDALTGGGKGSQNGGGNNGGNPPQIDYSQAIIPPVITAVDESDYTAYYIDSESGSDDSDGLSPQTPFKTLGKAVYLQKAPRTKLLLRSGARFEEQLVLKDLNGTPEKPFIVDVYGGIERPVVSGWSDYAVLIEDDNLRLRNIKVTNKTGTRGIRVMTDRNGPGAFANLEITGCRIEEVNWAGDQKFEGVNPETLNVEAIAPGNRFSQKEFGAIILETSGDAALGPCWFENVFITNNEIRQVCRQGILITGKWGRREEPGGGLNKYIDDEHNFWPHKNVVIQGNDFNYIGGDGVDIMGCDGAFIDHNRCFNANFLGRSGQASAGLWPYNCINVVMQFNEAAYTWLAHGSADGQGLDVDMACRNTIVQYNYVHHNAGGGMLLCNSKDGDHTGTVIRNNIFSENEAGGLRGSLMTVSGCVGATEVYNNIVIVAGSAAPKILYSDDWPKSGKSADMHFRNNIFLSRSPAAAVFDRHNMEESCTFRNNLFFQAGSAYQIDGAPLRYDPKIPAMAGSPDGFSRAMMLRPGEAAVYRDGLLFDGMLEKDIAGNPTQGVAYVGAFAK
jgi:hypothetical protein